MITLNGYEIKPTIFPDKTSQVWKLPEEILNATNFARIVWDFESEGELLHLAQLKHLLESREINSTLFLTYLPYGRQDKIISNTTTFALYSFCQLLNELSFNEVIMLDPHSWVGFDLLRNSKALFPMKEVAEAFGRTQANLVCYPDHGAVEKYTRIYKQMPWVSGEKERDQLTGNILRYELRGDVRGKSVLIVDDICDGGMTFILLAKSLREAGATDVNLFVTHGIFSKGLQVLKDAGISAVFTHKGVQT